MRILIIEDSDSIRRMLEALVSARADEVVGVATGAEGLDKAYKLSPDVVLLDLNLPGSYNGFEVCERLRADPATRSIPIVIVSARTDEASRRRALDAGASAYYTKPFSPTALLKEIEALKTRRSSSMRKAARRSADLAPKQPSAEAASRPIGRASADRGAPPDATKADADASSPAPQRSPAEGSLPARGSGASAPSAGGKPAPPPTDPRRRT